MDLCKMTLSKAINMMETELQWKDYASMNCKGQYIASELFHEIVLAIQYLHDDSNKNKKVVIHRDLKPSNILLTSGINGRFVKIADFGLSTYHEKSDQTHTSKLGTENYTAPEVLDGRKYDTRADLYSLGKIVQKLFRIPQENMNK